jgi:hypothetical protein
MNNRLLLILVSTTTFFVGTMVSEVSLPGVGFLKKDDQGVSADVLNTHIKSSNGELMVVTEGLGLQSKNKDGGRVSGLDGFMVAQKDDSSFGLGLITHPAPSIEGLTSVQRAFSLFPGFPVPDAGSLCLTLKGHSVEGKVIAKLNVSRLTDDSSGLAPICTLLFSDELDGVLTVSIGEGTPLILGVSKTLGPPISKDGVNMYRYAR